MNLFGNLGCDFDIGIIRRCTLMRAHNALYEITLQGVHKRDDCMYLDKAQLSQLMRDARVNTLEELTGCEVITQMGLGSAGSRAILPKGAHVELVPIDEDGQKREITFRQF